ncbi:MAG: hypothetical protein ACLSBH_09895 [Coprobacillus cateniformis]
MNKKFKEYRNLFPGLFRYFYSFQLGVAVLLLWVERTHRTQMIGALMLSLIALFLLLLRYKMVLFDDVMMIYEWKVAAMLPTMIEYKDIQFVGKNHSIM